MEEYEIPQSKSELPAVEIVQPTAVCKKCAWKQTGRPCVLPRCLYGVRDASDEPSEDALTFERYNSLIEAELKKEVAEKKKAIVLEVETEVSEDEIYNSAFDF